MNLAKRYLGLRARILILVVLAALLPAAAMVGYLVQQRDQEIGEAKRNLAALARNAGDDLEAKILGTNQLLFGLSQSLELDSDDREACSANLAEVLKRYPQYTGILTIKPDGELHCDSLRTGRKLQLSDRGYFRGALDSSDPVLEPVFGRLTGIGVVQVALGARNKQGKVKFVLLASLSLDQFARQTAASQPYPNTLVMIFDRAGTVMTVHPADQSPMQSGKAYGDSELFRFARAGEAGDTAEVTAPQGVRRVWALGTLPENWGTGLTLTLGVPSADLAFSADHRMRTAFAVIFFASLLVFVIAWALLELGIRRPLDRIMDSAARFSGGDLNARIGTPYPRGEIGELMQVLDNTSDEVQAQRAKIEYHFRQQGLIAGFGRQALASVNLDDLLAQAVVVVGEGLDAGFCIVLQLAPDGHSLVPKAGSGWNEDEPWLQQPVTGLDPGTHYRLILESRDPVIMEDAQGGDRLALPEILGAHGIRSGVGVLVGGESRPFGILGAYSSEARGFTPESADFLRSIANILETAVERRRTDEKLAYLAQFDSVTGLPNRNLFRDRLSQMLTQAQRNAGMAGVMFVDLDRFKIVNDTYGHGVGDKLLSLVARRLQECVRSGDTVGRLGGDEFAIALASLARADSANLVAQKVVDALERPFDLDGHETYMTASLGIAVYPSDGEDPDTLLKNADTAMYRAKEHGRNTYRFYLPQMNKRADERLQLETQLRGALKRNEFLLQYQPKASLASGQICGFEALLRWQRPGGAMVPPLEFISILEDTGLIVPIGDWIVSTVCDQLWRWKDEGVPLRPVAINLSARQFQQKNLDSDIGAILGATGVDPGLLEFELTESLLMSDAEEAVRTLTNMKSYGVGLSVDDFGTGYSSLAYLKRFPLDALKIDRTFIRDVTNDSDDATITVAMINLAHSLKLKVVAEGVETEAQLNFLRAHGCDEIQGYYFARPMPIAECTQALMEDRRLRQSPAESLIQA